MTLKDAIEHFRNVVRGGRVAHGYVVIGPPRGEAGAFVQEALRILFCEAEKPPCGECRNCRIVAAQKHPDILRVEPEKKSRAISIEQVRDLQKAVFQTSFAGSWKACVIMTADRLVLAAANAFLKTLEEPPERSIFFLVTDAPQALLPTILSRCQRLTVSQGQIDLPEAWRADVVAVLRDPGGGALAAFSRADRVEKVCKSMKEQARADEAAASRGGDEDVDRDTLEARIQARYLETRTGLMVYLLQWYRDLLILACGADEALVANRDSLSALKEKAGRLSRRQAMRDVATIEDMNRQLESHMSEAAVFGVGFNRLT